MSAEDCRGRLHLPHDASRSPALLPRSTNLQYTQQKSSQVEQAGPMAATPPPSAPNTARSNLSPAPNEACRHAQRHSASCVPLPVETSPASSSACGQQCRGRVQGRVQSMMGSMMGR